MTVEQPSLEEALEYIESFGGFEKAMLRNNLSKWLEYKDWEYHNKCVEIYSELYKLLDKASTFETYTFSKE